MMVAIDDKSSVFAATFLSVLQCATSRRHHRPAKTPVPTLYALQLPALQHLHSSATAQSR
jgi:hypothetical protein